MHIRNGEIVNILRLLGIASILGSIAIWVSQGGQSSSPEEKAHGERFGIFVGLWAPTFFILANHLNQED